MLFEKIPLEVETLPLQSLNSSHHTALAVLSIIPTINHLAVGFLFMSPGSSLLLARALKIIDQAFRADSEGCGANLYGRPSALTHGRQGSLRNITRLEPGLSHDANNFGVVGGLRAIGRSGFVGTPKIR